MTFDLLDGREVGAILYLPVRSGHELEDVLGWMLEEHVGDGHAARAPGVLVRLLDEQDALLLEPLQ